MVSPDGACSTNTLKKAFIPPVTPLVTTASRSSVYLPTAPQCQQQQNCEARPVACPGLGLHPGIEHGRPGIPQAPRVRDTPVQEASVRTSVHTLNGARRAHRFFALLHDKRWRKALQARPLGGVGHSTRTWDSLHRR